MNQNQFFFANFARYTFKYKTKERRKKAISKMNAIQHGDGILANLHKSLQFAQKYGDAGMCYSSLFYWPYQLNLSP